ncbi:MAG: hypothetical protein K2R98_03165 [Gemmataceae bacterium]|nr:hypothetical protein [Gemmataceae bacterium]
MTNAPSQDAIRAGTSPPPQAVPDVNVDPPASSSLFGLPKYPGSNDFVKPVRTTWAVEMLAGALLGGAIGGSLAVAMPVWPEVLLFPTMGVILGTIAGILTGMHTGFGGRWSVGGVVSAMGRVALVTFFLGFVWMFFAAAGVFFIPRDDD